MSDIMDQDDDMPRLIKKTNRKFSKTGNDNQSGNKSLSDLYSMIPEEGFRVSMTSRDMSPPQKGSLLINPNNSSGALLNTPSQLQNYQRQQNSEFFPKRIQPSDHNDKIESKVLLTPNSMNNKEKDSNQFEQNNREGNATGNSDLVNRYQNSVAVRSDKKKGELKEIENIPNSSIQREIMRLQQEMNECNQQIIVLKKYIDGNKIQNDIRNKFWEEQMEFLKEKQDMCNQLINLYQDQIILRANCELHKETVDEMVMRMNDIMNQMSEDMNNLQNFNEMLPSEREQELTRENQLLKVENKKERETRAELENALYQNIQSYQHLFVDAQEAKQIILNQLQEIKEKREKLDREEDDLELKKAEFEKNKRNFLISINSNTPNSAIRGGGGGGSSIGILQNNQDTNSKYLPVSQTNGEFQYSPSQTSLYDNPNSELNRTPSTYQKIFMNQNNNNNIDERKLFGGGSLSNLAYESNIQNDYLSITTPTSQVRATPQKSPAPNEYENNEPLLKSYKNRSFNNSNNFESAQSGSKIVDRVEKENQEIGVMKLQSMIKSIQQMNENQYN